MQLHVMKSCSNLHVARRERSWPLHSVLLPKLECFVYDELHRRIFGEVLVEGEAVMIQKMHKIKYTMHCIKHILYHTTTCLALYAWHHRERLSKTAGKGFVSMLNVEAQEGWLIVTTCTYVQMQQNACGKIFRANTYHFCMYFTICLIQQSRQLLHLALYRGQGNAPTIALITVTDGTAIAGSRQEATMCIQYVRRYSRLVPGTFSRAHRPTTNHCSY